MDMLDVIKDISQVSPSRIIYCVLDGLGGLPHPESGQTELETARTPNLNRLAEQGISGLIDPVCPGITPGSAPGHLGLFGYDPLKYKIGRGVLEATGIDFEMQSSDVATRGNFCTVDDAGNITDRRAGRIDNAKCAELCQLLDGMVIGKTTVIVCPVKEHRFIAVFRGGKLDPAVSDSDPQQTGVPAKAVTALSPAAAATATIANEFIAQASVKLRGHHPANMLLLRGFSCCPDFPKISEVYRLKPSAISVYPMYRGLARLLGMEILETGTDIASEFGTLERHYADYDFLFMHIKWTDSAGEDGDFERKVSVIEEFDRNLGSLTTGEDDVIVVTGDHSTPARLKGHSWHPVPVLLSSRWCRPDGIAEFSERSCRQGGLGRLPATRIMPLAMAHALKLVKYGA